MPSDRAGKFEFETDLVRQEVDLIIRQVALASHIKEGVLWQLSREGKVLCPGQDGCWAVLPLLVAEAICGESRYSVPAAAAVEFAAAAGDAFDDIQDHELQGSLLGVYGPEKTVNIAIALLMLSQLAVLRLNEHKVYLDSVVAVMDALCSGVIQSCAGQHRDLTYESEQNISVESYLHMIQLKTGAAVEASCRMGALVATKDPELISSFAKFGKNLGMASQILNDIESIGCSQGSKSDICKKKKTLPIIFALEHADKEQRSLLDYVYDPETKITIELQELAAKVVVATGGVYYSMILAEKYKMQAAMAIEANGAYSRLLDLI